MKNRDEEEFPKLTVKQENEFKKMKLSVEHGGMFFDNMNPDVPPEIEGKFLDYISNFENAFKNATLTTVFEKIGKPEFKFPDEIDDSAISNALHDVMELLQSFNIALDVLCNYPEQDRLLYSFIVTELFQQEIDGITIDGMVTHFIYEDFHQKHQFDLEVAPKDFLEMFLNKKSSFYTEYHSEDAVNHDEINLFRGLFDEFTVQFFDISDVSFNEKDAIVQFKISFSAQTAASNSKVNYNGDGSISFEYEYGFWYIRIVRLPV